jgi:hypothetical protein
MLWTRLVELAKTMAGAVSWTDVLLGTLLLGFIPFVLGAYGGQLAAETIAEPRRRKHATRNFWALAIIGVLLAFLQQYRAAKSDHDRDVRTDTVQRSIDDVLKYIHDAQKRPTETAASEPSGEVERRRHLLAVLRDEYILEARVVSTNLLAGTELPPSAWIDQKLQLLGEKWTVSDSTLPPTTARREKFDSLRAITIHVARWPDNYRAGEKVNGIEWRRYYSALNLTITNQSDVPIANIDINISTNEMIAAVAPTRETSGLDVITSPELTHIVSVVENGERVDKSVTAHYDYKYYEVSLRRLLPKHAVTLLVVPVSLSSSQYSTDKSPAQTISVEGTYETEMLDGNKRYPLKWTSAIP